MYTFAIQYHICLVLLYCVILVSCNSPAERFPVENLQVGWILEENQIQPEQQHQAKFLIKNNGAKKINSGWEIYFNTIFLDVDVSSQTPDFKIEHVSGDLFRMFPTDDFEGIAPNDTLVVSYVSKNFLLKNSHAPEGLFLVFSEDEEGIPIGNFSKQEIKLKDLKLAAENTDLPIPTYTYLFEQNEGMQLLQKGTFSPIIPTPKSYEISQDEKIYTGELKIFSDSVFESTA